jgi:hypothetical protein
MPAWFRRDRKAKVPVDALGRPFRSAVEPRPSGDGVASAPGAPLDPQRTAERAALAPGLDPLIFSDLDDLTDAMVAIDAGDCDRLLAFWRGIDPDARATAHEHAQELAESTDRLNLLRFVQDEMLGWAQGRDTGNRPHVERWFDPLANASIHRPSWMEALPALADAAAALALQDVLDDDDFDALFGPWLNAMGGGADDADDEEDAGDGTKADATRAARAADAPGDTGDTADSQPDR